MPLSPLRFTVCFCVLLAAGCASVTPEERVAGFDDGVRLYDAGKYEEAYKVFDDLSYVDAAAARNAGLMLRKGQGVAKDPTAAKQMFQFAAQAGLATAAADLGEMLLDGEGAPPNPHDALPWLLMAATAHHAIAEYHLGTMYEDGNGVPKDIGKARILYADSAASGYQPSVERLKALGGEPPALRSTTVDTTGPSRQSDVPAPSATVPQAASQTPAPPASVPASGAPLSADDYQDISKPELSPSDDAAPPAPNLMPTIGNPPFADSPTPANGPPPGGAPPGNAPPSP